MTKNRGKRKNFANNIKVLRVAKSLTQAELGATLGVTPGTICKWEGDDESWPSRRHMEDLANLFDLEVELLSKELQFVER